MEELYKNDLHDPENHDGVITHLEPDILDCEVKWALESITMNKASGGDGIPVQLFQILKDDAVKCCTQYASRFGKLSSGHRTGKGEFSFQSQRKAMPKMLKLPHNCTHLGDLPNQGIKPRSPVLWADSLPAEPPGKPKNTGVGSLPLLQQIFLTQESNRVSVSPALAGRFFYHCATWETHSLDGPRY